MKLGNAIQYMGASAPRIDPALLDRDVESFVIDSREVKAGNVFFALSQPEYKENGFNGDFEDGTNYVKESLENGAVAAVVRPDRLYEHSSELESFEDKMILADDVIRALQQLAHEVYIKWGGPVVAITGSAGKTTAKEITAHVLASSGRQVLRNIKNYNNGLGLPLTVLNLVKGDRYDVAVLEMGMSTPMNEIERLCRITPPDVAVVLNVLPVHVEHLGSIEGVQRAKAEIIEGMKGGGTAVLNADDPRVIAMGGLSKGDVITYGIDNPADIRAEKLELSRFGQASFRLTVPSGVAEVSFRLNGRHNVMNALAGAAVGHRFGMSASEIADSLSTVQAPSQRGEMLRFAEGFTIINDSYNSNPDALLSMIDTLVEGSEEGKRRVVVAGEMLELGETAQSLHAQVGAEIARRNVDVLIGVRGLAKLTVEAARLEGMENAEFAEDSVQAGEILADEIREGDVVLVKGSRGVRTERVIEKLLEKFELEKSPVVQR